MKERRITSLEEIFRGGESQSLELKRDLPSSTFLAQDLAALANSGGGTVVIGLDDRMTAIESPPLEKVDEGYRKALEFLQPPIESEMYTLDTIRGGVVCIDVEPSQWGPVLWEGVVPRRDGTKVRAAKLDEVRELLGAQAGDIQDVASMQGVAALITEQSQRLEAIRQDQLASKTLRSRLPDLVVGGVIGAILSAALGMLIK